MKNHCFCSLPPNPDSPKKPKAAIKSEILRYLSSLVYKIFVPKFTFKTLVSSLFLVGHKLSIFYTRFLICRTPNNRKNANIT